MQPDKLKIAFVDDHPLIMEGLKGLIQKENDFEVVGLFVNGQSFLDYLEHNEINVILLDISLPDIHGIELCKRIKEHAPQTIVLILSNHIQRSIIMQSISNGANGYLLKNSSLDEILESICSAIDGNIVFSKEVKTIISQPAKNQLRGTMRLTQREKEVIQLIAEGKTSNEIAKELYLSTLTIETHRKNLLQKFQVKNSVELIRELTKQQLL